MGVSVPTFSRSWNQNGQKLTHAGRISMTSAALANTSAAISTRAARRAIVAIVSYQILLIALIFLRPNLAPSWHTISEWAIGPYGWIMSAAFLISALSYAASRQILCRCTSRYPPGAHYTSYSAQASWCSCHFQRCLSTSGWLATTKRGGARRVLLWTAGLPLFGFLYFAVYSAIFVFPSGPGAYGPGVNIGWPPRFAFLTYML